MNNKDIVYIHFKHNLYGYAAINPDDFEKLINKDAKTNKDAFKVIFKINDILSGILSFKIRVMRVNKILKVRGLRNLVVFTKENEAYFRTQLSLNVENAKGWMLAERKN